MAAPFDTHQFVRRLREAGLTESQAEVMTDALKDALQISEVATRPDLRAMEERLEAKSDIRIAEVNTRIADVRREIAELGAKTAQSHAELLRWLVGLGIALASLLVAIYLRLPHG
jgi:hypothetical protein